MIKGDDPSGDAKEDDTQEEKKDKEEEDGTCGKHVGCMLFWVV
jgi:hypothetical protein